MSIGKCFWPQRRYRCIFSHLESELLFDPVEGIGRTVDFHSTDPESVERVFGDVAAVGDVKNHDVVAILGDEAHAAIRHSPATPCEEIQESTYV